MLRRLGNLISRRNLLSEAPEDWENSLIKLPARRRKNISVFIRHLDAGSSNDCELEISALSNPVYDFQRFGFHFVASPRHADALLVTGPFTPGMEVAALAAFRAMPQPRRVITLGDGFDPDGLFGDSYAALPLPQVMADAWIVHIPGSPPSPQELLNVLNAIEFPL
ncbi:MAG: hypothetical protein B6243_11775 [Anaerolineaceae bacterium 4572_5.2]|nr:MAG: hypothetical protein B6243_11775 [Anaerolineaceae bacterium 4572_5.2]